MLRVIATNIKLMHACCVKLCEIQDKVSQLKQTSSFNVNVIGWIKCDCYNVAFQVFKQLSALYIYGIQYFHISPIYVNSLMFQYSIQSTQKTI